MTLRKTEVVHALNLGKDGAEHKSQSTGVRRVGLKNQTNVVQNAKSR